MKINTKVKVKKKVVKDLLVNFVVYHQRPSTAGLIEEADLSGYVLLKTLLEGEKTKARVIAVYDTGCARVKLKNKFGEYETNFDIKDLQKVK